MTKPITTAAVMMLAEEKKISITDPVSKFLPEFKNLVVFDESGNHKPAKKQITIIDLMRHTSGLTYGFVGGDVAKIYKSKNAPQYPTRIEAVNSHNFSHRGVTLY